MKTAETILSNGAILPSFQGNLTSPSHVLMHFVILLNKRALLFPTLTPVAAPQQNNLD